MSMSSKSAFKKVGIIIQLEILGVSDVAQSYTLDFGVISQWVETESEDDANYSNMTMLLEPPLWTPDIQFYGTSGEIKDMLHKSYFRIKNIYYAYYDYEITFVDDFRLQRFPFDRQQLNVHAFSINSEFIDFDPSLGIPPCIFEKDAYTAIRLKPPEYSWIADGVSIDCSLDGNDSEMHIKLKLTRKPEFYVYNIVLVNFLIVIISISVYALDVTDFASRLGVLETNLLTAVAFKFVINTWVPTVSYLTLLDRYMILTFAMISLIVLLSFIMALLDDDISYYLNIYGSIIVTGFWVIIHILIIFGYRFQLFTPSWAYVESTQLEDDYESCLIQKKIHPKNTTSIKNELSNIKNRISPSSSSPPGRL